MKESEDDDRMFLLSLLPHMKSIPPHLKLVSKMEIMQTINKFISIQPPAPYQQSQQLYVSQQNQNSILQPTSTGVQSFINQSPSVYQEPQPGPSGIQTGYPGSIFPAHQPQPQYAASQQQTVTSPLTSPYSQDDTDISLF